MSTPSTAASASRTAADAVREMVLTGVLSPGDKVPPERELAQQLGLSRSSVREAVRELSALGILESRRGDGTYISTLESSDLFAPLEFALAVDQRSLLHMADVRLILEPYVACVAAAKVTPEQVEVLEGALARYQAGSKAVPQDNTALIEADETIHSTLVAAAGNPLIAAMVRSVSATIRRGRELTVQLDPVIEESYEELRAIVEAVRDGEPFLAQAAMTWHVRRWAEIVRRRT